MIPSLVTDPITHEMYSVIVIASVVVLMLFSALLFFIRRWFAKSDANDEKVLKKLDELREQRTACREELPTKYADKQDMGRLWGKVDIHESRISVLETKVG